MPMPFLIRSSKFRHVYGSSPRKDKCYENVRITRNAHDSNFCAVNPRFLAVVTETAGGGSFLCIPLHHTGRVEVTAPKVYGHAGAIMDIKWSPFSDHVIASCSEDSTVKIWQVPEEGLKTDLSEWLLDLHGHSRKVTYIDWHPTAENVLLSAGMDYDCILWNTEQAEPINIIRSHTDTIFSMAWNLDGSLFCTTCKDKKLRVIDPRKNEVAMETIGHQGIKPSKCVFLHNSNQIFTTGFARGSSRELAVWDIKRLDKPLKQVDVDCSSGVLLPYPDHDNKVIYVAGKGDANIQYYEVTDDSECLHFLNMFQTPYPQRSFGVMPKRGLNTSQCEIMRFYKLYTAKNIIEPISMIVPRKSDKFHEDIYPPTASMIPSLSADEWVSGQNREPIRVSLLDGQITNTPKYTSASAVQRQDTLLNQSPTITTYKSVKPINLDRPTPTGTRPSEGPNNHTSNKEPASLKNIKRLSLNEEYVTISDSGSTKSAGHNTANLPPTNGHTMSAKQTVKKVWTPTSPVKESLSENGFSGGGTKDSCEPSSPIPTDPANSQSPSPPPSPTEDSISFKASFAFFESDPFKSPTKEDVENRVRLQTRSKSIETLHLKIEDGKEEDEEGSNTCFRSKSSLDISRVVEESLPDRPVPEQDTSRAEDSGVETNVREDVLSVVKSSRLQSGVMEVQSVRDDSGDAESDVTVSSSLSNVVLSSPCEQNQEVMTEEHDKGDDDRSEVRVHKTDVNAVAQEIDNTSNKLDNPVAKVTNDPGADFEEEHFSEEVIYTSSSEVVESENKITSDSSNTELSNQNADSGMDEANQDKEQQAGESSDEDDSYFSTRSDSLSSEDTLVEEEDVIIIRDNQVFIEPGTSHQRGDGDVQGDTTLNDEDMNQTTNSDLVDTESYGDVKGNTALNDKDMNQTTTEGDDDVKRDTIQNDEDMNQATSSDSIDIEGDGGVENDVNQTAIKDQLVIEVNGKDDNDENQTSSGDLSDGEDNLEDENGKDQEFFGKEPSMMDINREEVNEYVNHVIQMATKVLADEPSPRVNNSSLTNGYLESSSDADFCAADISDCQQTCYPRDLTISGHSQDTDSDSHVVCSGDCAITREITPGSLHDLDEALLIAVQQEINNNCKSRLPRQLARSNSLPHLSSLSPLFPDLYSALDLTCPAHSDDPGGLHASWIRQRVHIQKVWSLPPHTASTAHSGHHGDTAPHNEAELRKAYFNAIEEVRSLKEQIGLKDKRIRQLEEELKMLKIPKCGPGESDC